MERDLEALKASQLLSQEQLAVNEQLLQQKLPDTKAALRLTKRRLAKQQEVLIALKVIFINSRLYVPLHQPTTLPGWVFGADCC